MPRYFKRSRPSVCPSKVPFLTDEIFLSTWPTTMEFAIIATAYASVGFSGSLLQTYVSPMVGVQKCLETWCPSHAAVYNIHLGWRERTHGFDWCVGHYLWIMIMFTLQPPNYKPPISILLHFSRNRQIKFPPIFPAIRYTTYGDVVMCSANEVWKGCVCTHYYASTIGLIVMQS